MANDNSQLQTAYQQGTATVDEKTFKKRHQKYGQKQRSRSHSGSRKDSAGPLNRRANANGVALKNTQLQMENVQP